MKAVPSDRDLAALVARFGVSVQVIWYRLRDVGYVEDERYRLKWAQWKSRTYEPPRRDDGGPRTSAARRTRLENGDAFVTAVLDARNRGLIGLGQAIEWLDVRTRDVVALEEQLSGSGAA
jgi:Zn-dependent peptidase ImmA (M78 family)